MTPNLIGIGAATLGIIVIMYKAHPGHTVLQYIYMDHILILYGCLWMSYEGLATLEHHTLKLIE